MLDGKGPELIKIIEDTATRVLHQNPGPVVRYRLLRDVLRKAPHDPELIQAKEALKDSHWVHFAHSSID